MTIPADKDALRVAFIEQREYTLALYQDLPERYWEPAEFPFSELTNPPLWELAHIAWFAEFFCCRWRPDDIDGRLTTSIWADADRFLNSSLVPHVDRWHLKYPDRAFVERYMQDALRRVLDELDRTDASQISLFQLALLHEDMHGEALVMTRNALGLCRPRIPFSINAVRASECAQAIKFEGGAFSVGAANQSFQFDNELPPINAAIAPFEVDSEPVSAANFAVWKGHHGVGGEQHNGPACHVTYADASAYAADIGRRLPTEAEWEFAATKSPAFAESSGQVWEWTTSQFAPRSGFVAGPYRDYSTASFLAVAHRNFEFKVMKGGSFATHPRLKYPQYRNFYSTLRNDMFCGFRTCRDW